jgi:ubiquinone biosynthesis protein COQ9
VTASPEVVPNVGEELGKSLCSTDRDEQVSNYLSSSGAKWRFANARPEPDFRYFSNRTASPSVGNSSETTMAQGR